jgi:hypothetical protein
MRQMPAAAKIGRLIIVLSVVAACSSNSPSPPQAPAPTPPPPPAPPPTSVERQINPQLTNAAINSDLAPHVVINPDPAVAASGRLFVMLPGTSGVPTVYEDVVRRGAQRGYHAIGLTYPNDDAVSVLCPGTGPADCAGAVRREVITGADASPLVAVDPANSIDGRLLALLTYLSANFPAEGWGRYLVNGAVDWSLITVAGHSQGAGHAGFIAKLRDVNRVVMFSGPGDPGASWVDLPNITAPARMFGFTHTADDLATLALVARSWDGLELDLFGASVSVDGASQPFGGSHQLLTSAAPNPNPTGPSASPTHGAPVVDAVTPRDAMGRPVFEPVWGFIAFP